MIIAKEKLFLKPQRQLQDICRLIEKAVKDGRGIDEMERELFAQLLELGRTLLQASARGTGFRPGFSGGFLRGFGKSGLATPSACQPCTQAQPVHYLRISAKPPSGRVDARRRSHGEVQS